MQSPESPPIMIYRDRILWVFDRTFELYSEKVRIRGVIRGNRFETSAILADLQSDPSRIWLRTMHFTWAAMTVAILSVFVILPFMVSPPAYILLGPGLIIFSIGPVLMFLSRKRIEFVQFKNKSGVVVLDLARAGPDSEQLDAFTNAMKCYIDKASSNNESEIKQA